jgi:hypothetical protein
VLKERLNTRALLRRKGMHLESYDCVFCSLNVEEELQHMLFHCPFAMTCWYSLNIIVPNSESIEDILEGIRFQLNVPFFMEIIVTMSWAIWIMRNDIIFKHLAHSIRRCKEVFKFEFALVILRAKARFHPQIDQWIEHFV